MGTERRRSYRQTNGAEAVDDKAFSKRGVSRSVVARPPTPVAGPTSGLGMVMMMGQMADEFEPWGRNVKVRDTQLRNWFPTENIFTSALGIVAARNMGLSWQVQGGPRLSAKMQEVLQSANAGKGWEDFVGKISVDLHTQDNGAFIEIVRERDRPDALPIAINSLDSALCWHTGVPETPVVYQDIRGKHHLLKWYNVVELAELPTPKEQMWGIQYCTLTRLLIACQIAKSTSTYKHEKISGRHNRAIHLVSGITNTQIQDAVSRYQTYLDGMGLTRYAQPLIVGAVDPRANLKKETLELASLPDGFKSEEEFKQYLTYVAMAFLSDYQDFAPLPGGNLGSSQQSLVLHMKSRGKGPALWMNLITHAMNFHVMPKGARFGFMEKDFEADKQNAQISLIRGQARAIRIASGELSSLEARQIALDDKDLPLALFLQAQQADATPDISVDDSARYTQQGGGKPVQRPDQQPNPILSHAPLNGRPPAVNASTKDALTRGLKEVDQQEVGSFVQSRIHRIFTTTADDLYALGYMNTNERIELSSLIGDLLEDLSASMGAELAHIVERNLSQEHTRFLLRQEAQKAYSARAAAHQIQADPST